VIDMHDYNAAARRYWWTAAVLGSAALAYAVYGLMKLSGATLAGALAGIALATVVGLFPVRIPHTKTSIAGGGDHHLLRPARLWHARRHARGGLRGDRGSARLSKRATSRIGTLALSAIGMMACGSLFEAVRGAMHRAAPAAACFCSAWCSAASTGSSTSGWQPAFSR
jgi:hypothetical protein